MKTRDIMIVVGEASGDSHAAKLVANLKKTDNSFNFYGLGGNLLQKQGVELIENIQNTATMGIFEVLGKIVTLYKILFKLEATLKTRKPDLLILVDFQEFNLKLAKKAKKLGIKTLFYIGPQVWAWRPKRLKKIRKIIDYMAVIFPFEVDFYKKYEMDAVYVGHPLFDKISAELPERRLDKLKIDRSKKVIAFLPGSREDEVKQFMPIFKKVAANLSSQHNMICLISRYAATYENTRFFNDLPTNTFVIDDFDLTLDAADFAVVASGTATLEAAIIGTPMLIVAKTSYLSYAILKLLVNSKYLALPNIMLNKMAAVELIQSRVNPTLITAEITKFFQDETIGEKMRADFQQVRAQLSHKPDGDLTAMVLKILDQND